MAESEQAAPQAKPEAAKAAESPRLGSVADIFVGIRLAASRASNCVGASADAVAARDSVRLEQLAEIAAARAGEAEHMMRQARELLGANPPAQQKAMLQEAGQQVKAAQDAAATVAKALEGGVKPKPANFEWPRSVRRPVTGDRGDEKVTVYIEGPDKKSVYVNSKTSVPYNKATTITREELQRIRRIAPHFVEIPAEMRKAMAEAKGPIYFATAKRL